MKSVLLSVRPQHVANILNGLKTIEIRKRFPRGYVGWVYIYVVKDRRYFLDQVAEPNDNSWFCWDYDDGVPFVGTKKNGKSGKLARDEVASFNSTVIARFWCDKVEGIEPFYDDSDGWFTGYVAEETWIRNLVKCACLTEKELDDYLKRKNGYAIHITKLEIFDKPKELSEFYGAFTQKRYESIFGNNAVELDEKYGGLRQPTKSGYEYVYPLTRAPQSWQFIEV